MKLWQVAKWEAAKMLKSRAFLIATLLTPLMIVAFGSVPLLVGNLIEGREREVGVYDALGTVFPRLKQSFPETALKLVEWRGTLEELIGAVEEGDLDGALVIEQDILDTNSAVFYARRPGDLDVAPLEEALTSIVTSMRLARAGYKPAEVLPLAEEVRIAPVLVGGQRPGFPYLAFGMAVLLSFGLFLSGIQVFQSVVTEKASRTVELMLSSVTANDLVMGKILGYGILGLSQTVLFGVAVYCLVRAFFKVEIDLGPVRPQQLIAYPFYFLLGHLLYSTLFAVVGAGTKDLQSGGEPQGLVIMLPTIPMILASAMMLIPDHPVFRALSFVPFFTPGMMFFRLGVGALPWWEIAATLAVLAASVFLLMRFAAKVFEVALLMYGKQFSLRELWSLGVKSFRRE